MRAISDLSGIVLWRAITATGETQVFHLKLIAEDWAGPGGKVEAVTAIPNPPSLPRLSVTLD